jgi:RND family efflux transporter MFP subunit
MQNPRLPALAATTVFMAFAACGSPPDATQNGPAGGASAPSAVEAITLHTKPVEQTTEFVGTIKSRRSTAIQPQVEGFITRIAVKSGDRVREGAVLMDIDSRSQQASISSLESVRAQRAIDVTYARQEADRAKKLLDAGAGSQMDADRAANALNAAEAQLRTADEQVRQQRTELAYYQVTAPSAGVIGDIPVHVGDRATKGTLLTTIDANEGLEVYLNVPVQQAPQLHVGLPVRIVDEKGQMIVSEKISFVSPSVDTATQTILAKVPVADPGAASGHERTLFRADQFVRVLVVWSTEPALTVPVTAVTRINGQFFVFVAERASASPASAPVQAPAAAGSGNAPSNAQVSGLVARQRAVSLGNVIANEYVVQSGLSAGEQLIVSGVQKIGDGAPVSVTAPSNASTGTH